MADVVAVTGADGFIGSHLVEALVRRGKTVKAMAQYNSFGSYGWLDVLNAEMLASVEVHLGDIRDSNSVSVLLDGTSTTYHLAALVAVPYSYRSPQSYVDTNVTGTLNVLEAARQNQVGRIVHMSTSEVYGTARQVPITEDHHLCAQSPYAASKIAADKLVESYHRSFELPVVTARAFNTYGPRQSTRAVIPAIITQLATRPDHLALGSLKPSRDFLYVADTVAALITLGESTDDENLGRVFNAGTGTEISIGELADTVAGIMGVPLAISTHEQRRRPASSEVDRLVCDATELRKRTGWYPAHDLRAGLEQAVQWYLHSTNLSRYRADRHL